MPRQSLSKFVDEEKAIEQETEIIEEVKPRKFKETEELPCVSITAGKLFLVGSRSNEKYSWEDVGDVQNVEYRDLMSEVRNHTGYVYRPMFIIQDKDFLAQHPDVEAVYGSIYNANDLRKVLTLPANQLKKQLEQLPVGVQNAVKDLAVKMIEQGSLDSIQKIKVIDEFFNTELLLKMTK